MPLTRENIRKQCEFAQQKTQAIVSFVVPVIYQTGKLKNLRIALKDNISLKGYPLQAGSKILEGYHKQLKMKDGIDYIEHDRHNCYCTSLYCQVIFPYFSRNF